MLQILLYFSAIFLAVFASSELSVLHTPSSIEFKGHDALESDTISDVLSAALGFSVENPSGWNGMYIRDPFNMPKAVVAIVVDGIDKLNVQKSKTVKFNLAGSSIHNSLDVLTSAVEQHHRVIDLDLSDGMDSLKSYSHIFGNVKVPATEKTTSSLKPQVYSEDKLFLQQMSVLNVITEKWETLQEKPILLTVRVSLSSLIAAHSTGSPAFNDAIKLLSSDVQELTTVIEKSFKGDCLIVLISTNEELSRSKRQVNTIPSNLNLALIYSADYPVIFNILLWFGVVFAFSLLAICLVIGTMDPGRDSIIYRMTLNRMKKEN